MTRAFFTGLVALALVGACDGSIGNIAVDDPNEPSNPTDPNDPSGGEPRFHFEPSGEDLRPGIRRLTIRQLVNTWESISGVRPDLSALPADVELLSIANDASRLTVRDAAYMQSLLHEATNNAAGADIGNIISCAGACTQAELRAFLERSFAHPVGDVQLMRYVERYADASGRFDDEFGRRVVLQMALISPSVIYRTEIGDGGVLTAHELAKKLSYFLTDAPPDDTLRAVADDGSLLDASVRSAQTERLLETSAVRTRVQDFFFDWLGLDHADLAARIGADELPEGTADAMEQEVRMLIDAVIFEGDGGVRDLLLSDTTFIDERLAQVYGMTAPAGGGFGEVSLDGTERLGLLTTGLVLMAHSKEGGRSPMQRGKFIVDELLCYGFPSDAGEAAMTLPADTEDLTFREKFGSLEVREDCAKCHRMINVGFAFDLFDNVGRRWETSFVGPEDAMGAFELRPFPVFAFGSTADAVRGIAAHEALGRCYSAQLYRFAQGSIPGRDDAEVLTSLEELFTESGGNVLQSLRLIANSDRFAAAQ
ncbi:MAG: hypothetical protein ACI9KE_001474 [Polyangiales bacterium]|jgi:hypothetical protein